MQREVGRLDRQRRSRGGQGVRGKSHGLDFLPPWDGDWEEGLGGEGSQAKCFFRQPESEEMAGIRRAGLGTGLAQR